ncbi:SDR family oxidoreductase, partial [Mycobacterium sp.]
EFGRLDGIAAIAGAVKQADLFALSDTDWDDALAVKLHSMRRLVLAGWPHLKATSGSVVITSGATAAAPSAALGAVSSINAFIAALAKAFADRGTTDGVRVNTLLPGPTLTARRHRMLELFAAARGLDIQEATDVFAAQARILRYGTVEEVAEGYAWLLSPHARWVHGTALRVDGGEAKTP